MRTYDDILSFLRLGLLRDTSVPPLWSDDILCAAIAQAHDEFAECTLCLRDSSSLATNVVLETGVDKYQLHAAVLAVLSAKIDGSEGSLVRAGTSAIDGYVVTPDTLEWLQNIGYGAAASGTPKVFTTDDSTGGDGVSAILRVWPTPAAADNGKEVNLRVVRLPLVQCSTSTLDKEPECPRQFRMGLARGAAAIAYGMQDSDGKDDTREATQRGYFEQAIKEAKAHVRSKMFAPLAWGFGRAGFSHER